MLITITVTEFFFPHMARLARLVVYGLTQSRDHRESEFSGTAESHDRTSLKAAKARTEREEGSIGLDKSVTVIEFILYLK